MRSNATGATYFLTVVTYQRRHFLCDDDVRAALRDAIIHVREWHEIDVWVLLPDHLHRIWTLPHGDANFALRWQQIRDEADYQRHMDYVHYNPLKHGLAARAIDWPYSSFQRFCASGLYDKDWAAADRTDV